MLLQAFEKTFTARGHHVDRRFKPSPDADGLRPLVDEHPHAVKRPAAKRGGFAQKFRLHRHVDDVGHDVPRLKQLGSKSISSTFGYIPTLVAWIITSYFSSAAAMLFSVISPMVQTKGKWRSTRSKRVSAQK